MDFPADKLAQTFAVVFGGGILLYLYYYFSLVTAQPNEWLLVIRNGKTICCGVGGSCSVRFGDQVVKFPSRINRVNFTASQITVEKQGIQVEGVLLWSIYREKDGPMRAYRNLGDDLKLCVPKTANETLQEMSNSIVRHRIANSTIEDILRKRDEVRNEIRSEMQAIVNGWGVWLESVEITDVTILSKSLFNNLQTEYREEQRQKAEIIRMNTDKELEDRRVEQRMAAEHKAVENKTAHQIFEAIERLKVQREKQKVLEKEQEIESLNIDSGLQLAKHRAEADSALVAHQEQLHQISAVAAARRQKELELERRQVEEEKEATERVLQELRLATRQLEEEQKLEADRLRLKMTHELFQTLPYEYAALDTVREIYSKLAVKELKMVNMSQTGPTGDVDPVAQMVNRLIANVRTTEKAIA